MIIWKFCTNFYLSLCCHVCRISCVRKKIFYPLVTVIFLTKFWYLIIALRVSLWFIHIRHVKFSTFIFEVGVYFSYVHQCLMGKWKQLSSVADIYIFRIKELKYKKEIFPYTWLSLYPTISNVFCVLHVCIISVIMLAC